MDGRLPERRRLRTLRLGYARGMNTQNTIAVALLFLQACGLSLSVPQGDLDQIARDVTAIGHPLAKFQKAEMVGVSAGGCSASHDTFVDVKSTYKSPMRDAEDEMTVRFYVHTLSPCKVTTQVLEDSGPKPVLLDNKTMSGAAGEHVCKVLSEAGVKASEGGTNVTIEVNTGEGDDASGKRRKGKH